MSKITDLIEKVNSEIIPLQVSFNEIYRNYKLGQCSKSFMIKEEHKLNELKQYLLNLQSIQSEQQEEIDALNELVIFLDSINLYNADRIAKLRLDTTRYKKLLEKITRKNLNEK